MAIPAGTKLGHFEVVAAIGAGGMGEVYKARDTRLDRIVAIKVLPQHLADKAELRERFEREARTIAGLNHPHICTLHDIGQQDGTDFLVMEYVEGETLATRLMKGPLPIDQVLQYAIEISDALDKAHRKGVTHRDIKPGNVMLTKSGTKLLDFGLAKLKQTAAPAATPFSQMPTMSQNPTIEGMLLGTVQYMAPEQVEGRVDEIDGRTDIFAFGALVYEMATGKKAFTGKTQASILAAIMVSDPPPMSSLQPVTPPALDRLVKTCLAKDPDGRWQSAGDITRELKWIGEGGLQAGVPATAGTAPIGRLAFPGWLPWVVAATAIVAALGLAFVHFGRATEEARVLRMSVLTPEKVAFESRSAPAVSPDGRRVAFVATTDGKDSLWVRDLDSLSGRALAGTEGAAQPFWSPDSRFIGFFANGKLKKIDVTGGPALSLCDTGGQLGFGGSWSKNDVIVYSPSNTAGLFRVPAAGGSATPLTGLEPGEVNRRFPWFLPDGHHFLYLSRNNDPEKTAVYVGDLDSKSQSRVIAATSNVVYTQGQLLFVRGGTLMAQAFDGQKFETTNDPVPVAEQVSFNAGGIFGLGLFSASQSGVLAYISGTVGSGGQLTQMDRTGKVIGTVGAFSQVLWSVISPDGNTVAEDHPDPQTGIYDVWLHDLKRGTASRFTFNSKNNRFPVWSPDGSHMAFASNDGHYNLYQKATSGTAQDEALDKDGRNKRPDDWSPDGRYIIEEASGDLKTGYDIWVLPLFGDRKPFPYLQTQFNEHHAKLSPDGHWLAYVSDETKRDEIYVQTFPTPGGKWQISTDGGGFPVWSRDGKELFFIAADQKLMAVEVKGSAANGGARFEAGVPKPLLDTRFLNTFNSWFDVGKDGRFLIESLPEQAANVPMTVVVDWQAGLKK